MTTVERKRIHLTETPRIAAIIERHTIPGEPRAATVARLLERVDALVQDDEIVVFHPERSAMTNDEVADLLDKDDLDMLESASSV